MEYLVLASLVGVPIAGLLLSQRATLVVLMTFVSTSAAGLVVNLLSTWGVDWHQQGLCGALVASQLVSLAGFLRLRSSRFEHQERSWIPAFCLLALVVLVMLVRVMWARPVGELREAGVLIDLPHFYVGEDNAKWMNILSQITQGTKVEIGGVGGVLVVFLAACWSVTKAITGIFGGQVNQQSVVFNSQFVASVGLSLGSPFVLLPHLETKRLAGIRQVLIPMTVVVPLLSASLFRVSFLGHLSEQLIITALSLSVSVLAASDTTEREVRLAWLLVAFSSTIWLGLHFFSAAVLILALGSAWVHKRKLWTHRYSSMLGILALLLPLRVVWDTYRYTNFTPEYLTSLFNAPGAVDAATSWQGLIAILAVVFGLGILKGDVEVRPTAQRILLPLSLVGYFVLVAMNDQWRTGKLNYGSTKLWFIMTIVFTTAFLVPAIQALADGPGRRETRNRLLVMSMALLVILTIDGAFTPLLTNLRSDVWSGYASAKDHSFRDFVRTNTSMPQDLDSGPIGCVVRKADGTLGINTETYSCTRFLVSLAGIETECNRIIEWQLGVTPGDLKSTLLTVQPDIRSRIFIELNEQNLVSGQLTLDEVIQELP